MPILDPTLLTQVDDEDLAAWLEEQGEQAVEASLREWREQTDFATAERAKAKIAGERARAAEARAEVLRQRVLDWMVATGKARLATSEGTFSVRDQGGTPSVDVLVEAEHLPLEFQSWRVSADRRSLGVRLRPGGELVDPKTGAVLARMAQRGKVLVEGVPRRDER